jgi:hypothetical protein
MLPYVPQDIPHPQLQAEVTAHMAHADTHMNEYQVPVDDAGIGEPQHEVGPMFLEDPIPAIPV